MNKASHLLLHGEKAAAVIIENTFKNDRRGGVHYPVIRFLTKKDKWVIQELSIGTRPAVEAGTKLEVIYDPDNPNDVMIHSRWRMEIIPRLFLAPGIAGLILGFLELLMKVDYIS